LKPVPFHSPSSCAYLLQPTRDRRTNQDSYIFGAVFPFCFFCFLFMDLPIVQLLCLEQGGCPLEAYTWDFLYRVLELPRLLSLCVFYHSSLSEQFPFILIRHALTYYNQLMTHLHFCFIFLLQVIIVYHL